ncbi:MAG: MOSC domain-containing protein [Acidimicrobiia bacterium]
MAGRVHQINVSQGGVPKRPVPRARITTQGVEGDRQADRVHHGGPLQTVCLYSLEVIEALQAEGHPIEPGFAGENLTLAGIDWHSVAPGTMIRAGTCLMEVTAPTAPCSKNSGWFIDGNFNRMNHSRHPGWSRMYARVIEEGDVVTGDAAEIVKDGALP